MTVENVSPAAPLPGGMAYEIVTGHFTGELNPADPHNAIITDLRGAPRNAHARVEYVATFRVARPVDPAKASGVLFYEVPNRGRGGVAADRDGHIRVISGWQGDITPTPGLQTIAVPIARRADGGAITGPVLATFSKVTAGAAGVSIAGGLGGSNPRPDPVSLDSGKARLWRAARGTEGLGAPILAADWAFADCHTAPFPGTPDPHQLCLKSGFDPDAAYTLAYQGKNPLVLGIGFAATRDLIAFLRSGKADDAGTPNPAGARIRWTVASSTSQSGNFLRSFVHLGFNADEHGARVFDGINPNIAARQVPLNLRFGEPGGAAGRFEAGSEGTLWWGRYADTARHQGSSSLLDRCRISHTCPKVIETLGASEFWGLRSSPGFVGTDAQADIALPANVRRYYFPSVTHGGGRGDGFSLTGDPQIFGRCLLRDNPNPSILSLRAAQDALIDWVRSGKAPPASRYPTLAHGDLVRPTNAALGWPAIPGAPSPEGKLNTFVRQTFGAAFRANDLSGITDQPPRIVAVLPSLVPRVNADGNETAGVPSVQLQVPIGTYTGWNVDTFGYEAGGGCGFSGGFIPFARTRAERLATGDPRLSLEERYATHAGFVAQIRAATARQQAAGWLRPDDAAALIAAAEASKVLN